MKEERLKVLELIENGKISAEEAAKLLDALKGGGSRDARDEEEDKLSRVSASVDSFAKDFKEKANAAFKQVEPRFKAATRTVIEKTVGVLDDISKSLSETLSNMEENAREKEKEKAACCENADEGCCENKEN